MLTVIKSTNLVQSKIAKVFRDQCIAAKQNNTKWKANSLPRQGLSTISVQKSIMRVNTTILKATGRK